MRRMASDKKRIITVFTVFYIIFGMLTCRIAYIQNSELSQVADMQFLRSISLGTSRGYIYDRNLKPLVNENCENIAVIQINEETKKLFSSYSNNQTEIKDGMIVTEEHTDIQESKFVKSFQKLNRYRQNGLCAHIIGYVNGENKGISGIEKAFDKILADASGEIEVGYEADASGIALSGDGIKLIDNNYNSSAGISLTIDYQIQKITEEVLEKSVIECGAVVVMSVENFEILACASVPEFSQTDVSISLENENLPFLNRALCAYPVGSVFKPVIAAAALENSVKISDIYECRGIVEINGNSFSCYSDRAHGLCDLNGAIEKSCNTFFIDMGIKTGANKIIETAEKLGFGREILFCSTLVSDAGNLPDAESISSDAQLANLCFGQGELLATPVQLTTAYCVFANKGLYTEPSVLNELLNENKESYGYYKSEINYRALSEETCEIINNCLYNNMLNGTGKNGAPENTTSAGKTATAQTGRYDENGKEILCTWFSGFFPFEEPEYVITVFNEKGSTASEDCAPVFKEIAEEIIKYRDAQEEF